MRPQIMRLLKSLPLGLFISTNLLASAGDQGQSSQQALQQLRLLQQRLANGENTQNQTPPTAAVEEAAQNTPQVATTITTTTTTPTVPSKNVPAVNKNTTNSAPAVVLNENELIDRQAFDAVSRQLFPLTPEQLLRLKQLHQTTEFADTSPVGVPPKPTATSQFVNLSPGSTPPVIRLSQGFVSSLVFLDSTGAPWPISAYDLGDPSAFNIQWDKTSNTLMIQAMKLYNYGNIAVRLKGLNTPVMLTLIPGQKAVDYRVDLRIEGIGPMAVNSMPVSEGLPPSANQLLLHVLDGVPPPGSKRLIISGGDARGWIVEDRMFIRTNLTILSPGWLASMTSADGMHAYEMQKSPVLLVSWHGKVMQLKIEGF